MKSCLLITTYNRGTLLERSLERLTRLTIPDEILVVDDGSNTQTDATEQICRGFEARLPIRYIYNNNPEWSICSFARNIGIKNTDAEIIITSEPELLFVTDVIGQMLDKHSNNPNHVISVGTIYHQQERAPIRDTIYDNPAQFLSESIVEDYQIEPRPYSQEGFCKTVNMTATFGALYRKEWLMKIGGWDEEFPGTYGFDDHDLLTRLRLSGYNQIISSEMEAIHQFHSHQLPHIQGPQVAANDQYWTSKELGKAEGNPNDPRLIANKGNDWGVIRE